MANTPPSFLPMLQGALVALWVTCPTQARQFLPDLDDLKAFASFQTSGDLQSGELKLPRNEDNYRGFTLHSSRDFNKDGKISASVTSPPVRIQPADGRWYKFSISGLAGEKFKVGKDGLLLQVRFTKDQGKTPIDKVQKSIYPQILRERTDLADEGTNRNLGKGIWRDYSLVFRTPFPEIDTLQATILLENGQGKGSDSTFKINRIELAKTQDPGIFQPNPAPAAKLVVPGNLVHLGGRWYYAPKGGANGVPKLFTKANASQLLYRSSRFIAPFEGNMESWLREGYIDINRKIVRRDAPVRDNLTIEVTDMHLVIQSKGLPNHPTAVFPDRSRYLDGNPNYIGEQRLTFYLPLDPKQNPKRMAMQNKNNNDQALPMGPIGVANNGIVFFNPFDHIQDEDAVWRLDRCCGHPAPRNLYHYHKYPVCNKTPWAEDGEGHSPVIGFAFDGYPVYGPYEDKGALAWQSKANPLNDFNVHQDAHRGWHYHVTPGKFPHIIGGYWGVPEAKNQHRGGGSSDGRRPGRRPPPRFDPPPPPRK